MDYSNIRHRLHELAEPSGCEVKTQTFLLEQLQQFAPTAIHTFNNSRNILAYYDFGGSRKCTLLRGDFDAVRIDETLDLPYASLTPGVSHKCGHDGHATILLGVAEQLHKHPIPEGQVLLFFQAGEETGEGANQLLETGILEQYNPQRVFALHNIPDQPLGTVICKPNSFTCSVISCDIELHGRTSHAAEPLKALSPYPAAKSITDALLSFNQYDIHREDFQLVTLVEFRVGEQAYGVTAGHGVLRFTLRAKNDEVLQETRKRTMQTVQEAIDQYPGLEFNIEWKEYFAASKNHTDAVDLIRKAAQDVELPYAEKDVPYSWGEDFGLLTQHYPGALFGLGSGPDLPPLHHQHFDFPDTLVEKGVEMLFEIVKKC